LSVILAAGVNVMTRDLNDAQKSFLLNEGDIVYLSGSIQKARSRITQVKVANITDESVIDFLIRNHGKIIIDEDIPDALSSALTHSIMLDNGTRGVLLSHFWEELQPDKKHEGTDNDENDVVFYTECLLMVDDKIILAPFQSCTKILET